MITARPRSEWQDPAKPVASSSKPARDRIVDFVVHYPGADWSDLDFDNDGTITTADTTWLLRAMQTAYLGDPHRGYSLGYCWLIDPLGLVWQIRGLDYRNAANKGSTGSWNLSSVSVIVVVDEADPMNPQQLTSLYRLYDEVCVELGRELHIRRHGDGDATPCPGAGITAQLAAGRPKPPLTTPEETTMPTAIRIKLKGTVNEFLIGYGPPLHLTPELAKVYESVPVVEVAMTPQLARTLSHQAGFTPELVVGTWVK